MHTRRIWIAILIACVFTAVCQVGRSQATTSLSGRVTDQSGAVVAGAKVTATSATTSAARTASTNSNGEYQFSQLAPGKYNLTVTAAGFEKVEKTGMDLLVGQPASMNVSLGVASVTSTVTVTEAEPVMNTTDATLGNAFDAEQVEQLPIEGRNVPDLLSLQPGVTFLGRTDDQNGTNAAGNNDSDSRSGSVNGGRSDQSNITLDGVDVNDINNGYAFTSVLRVTQDSVAEFRVTTSNPNADEGRSSGAQVALVTRSGTNQYHGAAYEYNRSNFLEANDFFNKQQQLAADEGNKPPKLIRNVFGVALGGPIKKDRVFLFMNYEGRRDDEGVSVNAGTVPTAFIPRRQPAVPVRERLRQRLDIRADARRHQGDGSPGDRRQPGDAGAAEPVSDAHDPTQGDGVNVQGYRFPYTLTRSYNTYIARLDWVLNAKNTLFWRGNLQNDDEPTAPAFPGQPPATSTLTNNKGFAAGETAILTPNLVNTIRYGLTRQGVDTAGTSDQAHVYISAVAQPEAFTRSTSVIVPVQNIVDDVSWTRHTHNLAIWRQPAAD